MAPLMILALWIGVYPKPFLEYIQQPVNAVVKQVRPDYVIPGEETRTGSETESRRIRVNSMLLYKPTPPRSLTSAICA
jgi:hypothetical protein